MVEAESDDNAGDASNAQDVRLALGLPPNGSKSSASSSAATAAVAQRGRLLLRCAAFEPPKSMLPESDLSCALIRLADCMADSERKRAGATSAAVGTPQRGKQCQRPPRPQQHNHPDAYCESLAQVSLLRFTATDDDAQANSKKGAQTEVQLSQPRQRHFGSVILSTLLRHSAITI